MENTCFAMQESFVLSFHYIFLFNTFLLAGSYNFGYEVGPNRQFHHEIRGADGVTYGCFGYVNTYEKLLVTHYVADRHGYRTITSNKAVKIYPIQADPKYDHDFQSNEYV